MAKLPRGRPAHVATELNRRKVRVLRADGRTVAEISVALEIPETTLKRYYHDEIETGRMTLRADIMAKMAKLATGGSIAAARLVMNMMEKGDVREAQREFNADTAPVKKTKLGKKEQAVEEARTAGEGTEWGDLLDPNAIPAGIMPN